MDVTFHSPKSQTFGKHVVNPSWLAAASLAAHPSTHVIPLSPSDSKESEAAHLGSTPYPALPANTTLVVKEIPVRYKPIQNLIPPLERLNHKVLLENHLPPDVGPFEFILHIGVGLEGAIQFEQRGRNATYDKLDNDGSTPEDGLCIKGSSSVFAMHESFF
jgi:hypothetical protein